MKRSTKLEMEIDRALSDLLSGKSEKSKEEKEELRRNLSLAIKWQAVKSKKENPEWGSGFTNGEDKTEEHKENEA